LKFGYATWIFCQIVGEGKGILQPKAFFHIILTSDSSARDKIAYQEPTQISRVGIERESASHFCFTKDFPCTQERLKVWDWYILSKQTLFWFWWTKLTSCTGVYLPQGCPTTCQNRHILGDRLT
jgi:hypothetical protein